MQIESLSLFLAVVESKSLTKASKQFCITPQGASASIRTLEKQLDTQLFVRSSGGALEPTKEGLELAKEAERVVGAYRSLQTVAAMQKSGRGRWAQLHVVVSPFVHQSIAFLIEEYVLRVDPELRTSIEVQSSFEIAKQFDKADDNTLYLIDLPLELKPFENSYPADFIKKVVFDRDYFKPFFLSSFRLICSDNSAYAKRASVKWSEIETEKLACHNDSFLLGVIGQQTNSGEAVQPGLMTMDPDILDTAVNEYGMVGLCSSLPEPLRMQCQKAINGKTIPLEPKISHVAGILGASHNEQAGKLFDYVQRSLRQSFPTYVEENDPALFFKINRPAFNKKRPRK